MINIDPKKGFSKLSLASEIKMIFYQNDTCYMLMGSKICISWKRNGIIIFQDGICINTQIIKTLPGIKINEKKV